MIIDCHGHYTTAPAAHTAWREQQVAAWEAGTTPPAYPSISDDEIRETIETSQLRLMDERGIDVTLFSPRASAMAPPRRRRGGEPGVVAPVQRPGPPGGDPLPGPLRAGGPAAAVARGRPRGRRSPSCAAASRSSGFVGCNLNPDPSGGFWTSPPLTDRSWYPLYEAAIELDVPAMVHVSASATPVFHGTGAYYINADTTAFMQLVQGNLFGDLPDLRLVIPHGGGAVPYHWGRYRGGNANGVEKVLNEPSVQLR